MIAVIAEEAYASCTRARARAAFVPNVNVGAKGAQGEGRLERSDS